LHEKGRLDTAVSYTAGFHWFHYLPFHVNEKFHVLPQHSLLGSFNVGFIYFN